jgi:outer membrane PBP1 activator LpoA protein
MKALHLIAACTLTVALSGCAELSAEKYAVAQTLLQGSPQLRTKLIEQCAAKTRTKSKSDLELLAAAINTSVPSAPRTACSRIINAMTSGRMTREQYNAAGRGDITPAMIRIIQGR